MSTTPTDAKKDAVPVDISSKQTETDSKAVSIIIYYIIYSSWYISLKLSNYIRILKLFHCLAINIV